MRSAFVFALLASASALQQLAVHHPARASSASSGALTVQRVEPGDGLEPELAKLLIQAFYERPTAFAGPIAWAQRQVITANVLADLSSRLNYYERAREQNLPHCGAVLAACLPGGEVCGFVDIGRPNYLLGKGTFALPPTPAGLGATQVTVGPPAVWEGGWLEGDASGLSRAGGSGSAGDGADRHVDISMFIPLYFKLNL